MLYNDVEYLHREDGVGTASREYQLTSQRMYIARQPFPSARELGLLREVRACIVVASFNSYRYSTTRKEGRGRQIGG